MYIYILFFLTTNIAVIDLCGLPGNMDLPVRHRLGKRFY